MIDLNDWQFFATRNMSHWHQTLSVPGHVVCQKLYGVDAPFVHASLTEYGTRSHIFVQSKQYTNYIAAIMRAVETSEKRKQFKVAYLTYARALKEKTDAAVQNLTSKTWEDFLSAYKMCAGGLSITTIIGRTGSDLLRARLQDVGVSEADLDATMATLTYPTDRTPLFASQYELLQIAAHIQAGVYGEAERYTALQEWLDRHQHIPVNFCDEPWTRQDIEKRIDDMLRLDPASELSRLQDEDAKKREEALKMINEIGDERVTGLSETLAEATYLNEFRKNTISRASLHIRPCFQMIAERAGSSRWRDCFYLKAEETQAIVDGAKLSMSDIVAARDLVGMYVDEHGNICDLTLDEASMVQERARSFITGGTNQTEIVQDATPSFVKGFSASRGKIIGTAKIVLHSGQFDKVEKGDILVTTMTSVDFVPIMEKAAAFVTNEGGITCHASIVAREMGKPCIIGTKTATQVFKDGDMVEVDAEKGVVRKLAV